LNILKIKESLNALANKENELFDVIDFSNKFLSIKSSAFNFSNQVCREFETLYSFLKVESAIEELFDGKKVNFTENKSALHWQIRDCESDLYKSLFENLRKAKSQIESKNIKNVVSIGIGGSFEGPKLLIESLIDQSNSRYNHVFVTGSDNQEFYEKTSKLDQKETIFIICSKSMKTIEVLNNFMLAKNWLLKKIDDSKILENFFCITSNPDEARERGFLEENLINLNKNIGGRFSIWSEVSISSFLESEEIFKSFLEGGFEADTNIRSTNDYKETIKKLSFIDLWNSNYLNTDNRAVLSYIWKLRSFSEYIQQLEMESLGKMANVNSILKKTSQTIYGGYGPRAQHSFFQMLHQGTSNTCLEIILSNDNLESNKLPKIQALIQNELFNVPVKNNSEQNQRINSNISSNLFTIEKVNPFNLGFLISSWEHKTFISSQLLQINPFDQFGVDEGKNRINKKFF
jgi:glucose-6-phosphate isomerase